MKTIPSLRPSPVRSALARVTIALCLAGTASSAEAVVGSGHVISETRNVSGFHGVELGGSGDVVITQGDTEGLVIEAEDNLLPLIESQVDANGVLHLGFKSHSGRIESKKDVVYKLSVKALDKMMVAGSGSIHAASFAADRLDLILPGSGEIAVDHLKVTEAAISIEGSGTVKLAGEARRQKVGIDGSGNYEGKDFRTAEASVGINGSGECKVSPGASLAVEINGSGEVGYYGSPVVKKSVNGSGEVRALGAGND